MRILYIQPAEGFGGAERQGVVHIRHLRELGYQVVPLVGPGRPIRRALEDAGIHDYVFTSELPSDPPRPLGLARKLAHGAGMLGAWWRASRQALETARAAGGVDVVFASRPIGWAVGTVAARRLGVPIVWRAGTMLSSLAHQLAVRWLGRWFRPHALITNARALHKQIAHRIAAASSHVIRNGVDVERFSRERAHPRFRAELGIDPRARVVGVAARPHPDKGFDLLGEVVARVGREIPDLRVLVAGDDGWRGTLERRFAAAGLGGRVTFLGHVRDIENFYRSCDVVALASKPTGEVVSNAVLEAMAMERPIVATRVGGLDEVITHGVEGLLSPSGDARAYARHLTYLLTDEIARRRMGVAGRATIVKS